MDAKETRRYLALLQVGDGCFEWQGTRTSMGYGMFSMKTERGWWPFYAHRLAYELFVGPIPDGFDIDHLCRNPPCCNPGHLEAVTHKENMRRGIGTAPQIYAAKTYCKHGHPFDLFNTKIRLRLNHLERVCIACEVAHRKAFIAQRSERRRLAREARTAGP